MMQPELRSTSGGSRQKSNPGWRSPLSLHSTYQFVLGDRAIPKYNGRSSNVISIAGRALSAICYVLLLSSGSLAAQNKSSTPPFPQFVDVAPQVGLTVSHLASKNQNNIANSLAGGWDFLTGTTMGGPR